MSQRVVPVPPGLQNYKKKFLIVQGFAPTMLRQQDGGNPLQFLQRGNILRCFRLDHLLSPTHRMLSSPNTASRALSSHPLNSHTDPTSTTYSGDLFQSFTTRTETTCLSTRWLRVLAQFFSRSLLIYPSLLSGIKLPGDRVSQLDLN